MTLIAKRTDLYAPTGLATLAKRLGGTWHGLYGTMPCPVCQPEHRRDQSGLSLREANGRLLAYCHKSNCDFRDILAGLGLHRWAPLTEARAEPAPICSKPDKRNFWRARTLWERGKPIRGTLAEAYLRGRGITCDLTNNLRFLEDAYHAPSDRPATAMVANIEPTGGVHRTFFSKGGHRLTKNAKMMLGPCAGGAVHLSGGAGPLVVCEGIETGLSLVQMLLDRSPEVWAALSTSGVKALVLPPRGNREMVIATDGDTPGRCAANALATRASSFGWPVSILDPGDGNDFNDVLNGDQK